PIRKVAAEQGTNVESVVNEWLSRQLALAREQKIREESARFRAKQAELRARYAGRFVAMRSGEVLDDDEDAHALYLRIRKQYADEPILIAPVSEQPIPVYKMRSPRAAA
ncbi:MAG: hypothetical protein AAB427_00025, partial [Chloroflexota bacterium]